MAWRYPSIQRSFSLDEKTRDDGLGLSSPRQTHAHPSSPRTGQLDISSSSLSSAGLAQNKWRARAIFHNLRRGGGHNGHGRRSSSLSLMNSTRKSTSGSIGSIRDTDLALALDQQDHDLAQALPHNQIHDREPTIDEAASLHASSSSGSASASASATRRAMDELKEKEQKSLKWNPHPLRTSFILVNIILFVVCAFVLEVLYAVNKKDYGWVPPSVFLSQSQAFSAFLNVAPGLFGWMLIQPWMEIDRLVKLLQPYHDMSTGSPTAKRSVLLDYAGNRGIPILGMMVKYRHYTPLLTTLLCALAILLSPLFSAMFHIAPPPNTLYIPLGTIRSLQQLGTPSNFPYAGLNSASAFANAAATLNIPPPPNVMHTPVQGSIWSIPALSLTGIQQAGLVTADSICVKTSTQCSTLASITLSTSGILSGTSGECHFSTNVTKTGATALSPSRSGGNSTFGVAYTNCSTGQSSAKAFRKRDNYSAGYADGPFDTNPVVFWMLYSPSSSPSSPGPNSPSSLGARDDSDSGAAVMQPPNQMLLAAACAPTVSVYNATVLLNATSSTLYKVEYGSGSGSMTNTSWNAESSVSANPPSVDAVDAGKTTAAYNGLFSISDEDTIPAMLQSIQINTGYAVAATFQTNVALWPNISDMPTNYLDAVNGAYGMYLGVATQSLYFTDTPGPENIASFNPLTPRLFMNSAVTHVVAVLFLIMAALGVVILLRHRKADAACQIRQQPGTIAAAVALAGSSDLSVLVRPSDSMKDMDVILKDYSFKIDKESGCLTVETPTEIDDASSTRDPERPPTPTIALEFTPSPTKEKSEFSSQQMNFKSSMATANSRTSTLSSSATLFSPTSPFSPTLPKSP